MTPTKANNEETDPAEVPGLDELLAAYKAAVERWITAIRNEEALAVPDHSMRDWEVWDRAVLDEKDAGERAAETRKAYEDALRKSLLNF